ncbi:MAG: N-glycosylase/DNA lyase [Spirochaetota bacterium]|nr:N-glycosylase/DNA lyase [Spirochaetota bacterium]
MNQRQKEIVEIYNSIRSRIETQLESFRRIWIEFDDKDIFAELVFCLLTPQSRAKSCWIAVNNLRKKNLLFNGCYNDINMELNLVRFKNRKTEYILLSRNLFITDGKISLKNSINQLDNVYSKRDWLVERIKGFGYKEASHFLRNIGFSENIAILDRHILKNLRLSRVIDEIPDSLSKKRYIDMENRMKDYATDIRIPLNHLDFVFWYMETGDVFK